MTPTNPRATNKHFAVMSNDSSCCSMPSASAARVFPDASVWMPLFGTGYPLVRISTDGWDEFAVERGSSILMPRCTSLL